jgi:hypothetical protein
VRRNPEEGHGNLAEGWVFVIGGFQQTDLQTVDFITAGVALLK